MAKYGIPYKGSKTAIADGIIEVLPKGKRLVDLFGGGGAITHGAVLSGKWDTILYNDINPLLVPLFKKAINGEFNYDVFKPEWIDRETFHENKTKDGHIKYIWSFGNNGRDYLFSKELEPKKKSLHNFVVFGIKDEYIEENFNDIDEHITADNIKERRLQLRRYIKDRKINELEQLQRLQQLERLEQLQRLEQLERLEFKTMTYTDYEYQDGDIVYCDPPYENTDSYNDTKSHDFDSLSFYEWVHNSDFPVYFSSYDNISDKTFKCIYSVKKRQLITSTGLGNLMTECVYCNDAGFNLLQKGDESDG